jgi:PAS domain S-box-containing protein
VGRESSEVPPQVEREVISNLRAKLREAEETLDAIRYGKVDAVLVNEAGSNKIFTLVNADRPYRFLIEQMKEGAVTLSEEGVILYANSRLGEILGSSLEKIIGSNIKRFFSEEDIKRFDHLLLAVGSESTRAEFIVRQAQGSNVPVYISIADIVSGESTARLIGAVVTDLSKQHEMEARVNQAQKMEAVGQLTGGLAHDFNNLLQAICANLDLISLYPSDVVGVRKWADNGLRAAAKGTKLTAQLLAFSRLQTIDVKPVDVTRLVLGMADLLLRTLGAKIEIEYQLEKTTVFVLADETQLELALLNLAINARDAMSGGGKLFIATKLRKVDDDPELGAGTYLELSVRDSGAGMPDAVRSRAFDPFFTTKSVGEGTGLGLAQVYGIARQAGGTARIVSSLKSGTTVSLYLRQSARLADASSENGCADKLQEGIKVAAKILIVDDDSDIRGVLAECLTLMGYQVSAAPDGVSALELMAENSPDLLLTDYLMPGMDGAELVRLARGKGFDMPVIFASGYSNTEALNKAVGLKANVLVKPFSIHKLVESIESALLNR